MTPRLTLRVSALWCLIPLLAHAQEQCGTMAEHQRLLATDPQYAAAQSAIEAQTQSFTSQYLPGAEGMLIRIPCVVHVLWNTQSQNISNQQILSQIDILNEDFRRQNADAVNTPAMWQGIAADSEFEFCLATRDPGGAPTTGITRTQTNVTSFNQNGNLMKFTASGGRDAWPTNQYLNIWVCNLSGGLLGYAQFPGGAANTDGVVIRFDAFGRVGTLSPSTAAGRTTTHEVGHWFNLRHIWGDNQPMCGDDFVADTPMADGPNYGCQVGTSSCGGTNMVQNYMDYSDDTCMNLFTQGQKVRMQALFAPGGARVSLLTSPAACSNMPNAAAYQVNQAGATVTFNGQQGSTTAPSITQVGTGVAVQFAMQTNLAAPPLELVLSFGPLIARSAATITSAGGQVLNIDFSAPYVFLNSGGPQPLFAPLPINFSIPINFAAAGSYAVQMAVLTPTSPDGVLLSQGCQANVAPPSCNLTFPAGPTGDDSTLAVPLTSGPCSQPVTFYGTAYTTLHVSSNGRVCFGTGSTTPNVTLAGAMSGPPFVGFWTDLDPSAGGIILISKPSPTVISVSYNFVPYYAEPTFANFSVDFDTQFNQIQIDGLQGILFNTLTQAANQGQNQFLGLSRGVGATNSGSTLFTFGGQGVAPNSTAMIYDVYDVTVSLSGLVPSVAVGTNRVVFVPATNGNYAWFGF